MAKNLLGIVTNDPHDVFQSAVIAGIRKVANEHHYDLAIYTNPEASGEPIPSRVDGLLVIANVLSNDMLRHLYEQRKPLSLVSHRVPDTPIPVVLSNNQQGISELVQHLVKRCNRTRMVFIRGLMDQADAQERELAFRQEMIRFNLRVPPHHFLRGDFSPDVAAASIKALLRRKPDFDSVVASDYPMAIAAVQALREAGLSVPQQVSVVGFGDNADAEAAGLTTLAATVNELGACAARQLISQIRGARISGVTMLAVRLVIRETCGYRPKRGDM
jgi:LacI family transcriptional regulator